MKDKLDTAGHALRLIGQGRWKECQTDDLFALQDRGLATLAGFDWMVTRIGREIIDADGDILRERAVMTPTTGNRFTHRALVQHSGAR